MKNYNSFKNLLVLILIFISIDGYANIGLPAYSDDDQIVRHQYYTLKYNESTEQASWVAFAVTKKMQTVKKVKRINRFKSDRDVSTESASPKDYRKSGYDRGHLCPSAAMSFSKEAMLETFYMSNMSPQKPGFNRGIWKKLESKVRKWAVKNDKIYVVTGPIFYPNKEHKEIGSNGVDVPDAYYKVILDFREPSLKAIAFIFPNQKSKEPLSTFVVTVDQAEEVTGIDFFPELPDYIEDNLESKSNYDNW